MDIDAKFRLNIATAMRQAAKIHLQFLRFICGKGMTAGRTV